MLEWNEYLKTVVDSDTILDNIALFYNGRSMHISPIVKASILMLEDMISSQGHHNIFVFPEIEQYAKEFLLGKVIYNIGSGKIQMQYDPDKFQKGQKLKYKGCTVEYDSIEENKDVTRIFVKFADGMRYGVPIEIAPFFQIAESKSLSTYKLFKTRYSPIEAKIAAENPTKDKNIINKIENHKTHLNGSIFYVSEIKSNKEFLLNATLEGRNITDVLYLAQANGDGEISNMSAGQLYGNPAIILVSDLYAVTNAINKGVKVQSVIFDASVPNAIEKQLDAFDSLSHLNFPVVCITDTKNSFALNPLSERGYNLWRWDSNSITGDLQKYDSSTADRKTTNCWKQKIEYKSISETNISNAVKLLYKQKSNIEEQSPGAIAVYEKLFSLAFVLLRNIIPIESFEKIRYTSLVTECITAIEKEKRFISTELYNDLAESAQYLSNALNVSTENGKYNVVCEILLTGKYKKICIVIPERLDRSQYENYWNSLELPAEISVKYPMEYSDTLSATFDLVIVTGWLSNKIMRNIIYGFSGQEYLVLTYPCEERWKRAHTSTWKRALNNSSNGEIVKKSFNKKGKAVSSTIFEHDIGGTEEISDELEEIEQVIKVSKYKRYNGSSYSGDIVDAYPVSFVGGLLAFYRSGHKVVTASDIIAGTGEKISSLTPDKLSVGDFVVIREAERDIIRDIADRILESNGKLELRQLSAKWKESLSVEVLFSTYDEIYQKLCDNGCKKDFVTVKNWITNEDLIQPNDMEDMICIAAATEDEVLLENIDKIYEAGREVRSAHVQAGRVLSQRLKNKIAEYIQQLGEIDTFNIWDPITLQLEEVGLVKILKIIDVGTIIPIDYGNTNRLLSE